MNDDGTLTPATGANEQAVYMITQVSYSISNFFLSILLIIVFFPSQIRELCRKNVNLKAELQNFIAETTSLLKQMNNNAHKFITALAIRIKSREDPVERDYVKTIPLIQCPFTLDILWMKYKFGIGGNKPAKLFTARESGNVKFFHTHCANRFGPWLKR